MNHLPISLVNAMEQKSFRSIREEASHAASFIEQVVTYLGTSTILWYGELQKQDSAFTAKYAKAFKHLVFISLSRPTFGQWLYITKFFCREYQFRQGSIAQNWDNFFQEHFVIGTVWDELLHFRNEIRHGSTFVESKKLKSISQHLVEIQKLLNNLEPLPNQNIFWNENGHLVLPQKSDAEFYQQLGWEKAYQDFLHIVAGKVNPIESKEGKDWPQLHSALTQHSKILIRHFPLQETASILSQYIKYHQQEGVNNAWLYSIDQDPILAEPEVFLRSVIFHFTHEEIDSRKFPFLMKHLEKKSIEFKTPRIIFISGLMDIDGVFSLRSLRQKWQSFLKYEFPNIKIVILACQGVEVPPFYDQVLTLSEESSDIDFNSEDGHRLMSYFSINESWEKEVVATLCQHSEIDVKEIAEQVDTFTPKVEKFLQKLEPILIREAKSYRIFHPQVQNFLAKH